MSAVVKKRRKKKTKNKKKKKVWPMGIRTVFKGGRPPGCQKYLPFFSVRCSGFRPNLI
jgi:hypothetical protein